MKSPSRPVLAVAVLFTVAVLVSLPTGKLATSTRASPNELLYQLPILDRRAHLKQPTTPPRPRRSPRPPHLKEIYGSYLARYALALCLGI